MSVINPNHFQSLRSLETINFDDYIDYYVCWNCGTIIHNISGEPVRSTNGDIFSFEFRRSVIYYKLSDNCKCKRCNRNTWNRRIRDILLLMGECKTLSQLDDNIYTSSELDIMDVLQDIANLIDMDKDVLLKSYNDHNKTA